MNKKLIRLTESDLHRIVKESVNRILSEMNEGMSPAGREALDKLRHLNGNVPKAEKEYQMDRDFYDIAAQAQEISDDHFKDRTRKPNYQYGSSSHKFNDPSYWSSANYHRNLNVFDSSGREAMAALDDKNPNHTLAKRNKGTIDSLVH